jgi:hypothetical protein
MAVFIKRSLTGVLASASVLVALVTCLVQATPACNHTGAQDWTWAT